MNVLSVWACCTCVYVQALCVYTHTCSRVCLCKCPACEGLLHMCVCSNIVHVHTCHVNMCARICFVVVTTLPPNFPCWYDSGAL